MKIVELETWNRHAAYEYFKDYDDPFFNLTANLDVTALLGFCRKHGLSFSLASLFYSIRAANGIREMRMRIIGEDVVEFDEIHATQTILNDDDSFSFCYYENTRDVFEYDRAGRKANDRYARLKTFDVESERIDLIYYSVIPWVSFTSFKHAVRFDNTHSVPRMVFGKYFAADERVLMPHSVELHHALADGLHAGRYFQSLQDLFDSPGAEETF